MYRATRTSVRNDAFGQRARLFTQELLAFLGYATGTVLIDRANPESGTLKMPAGWFGLGDRRDALSVPLLFQIQINPSHLQFPSLHPPFRSTVQVFP